MDSSSPRNAITTRQRDVGERLCRLIAWSPWPYPDSPLAGHAAVAFAGGINIVGVPIFRSSDGLSVGVPTAARLDSEGRVRMRDGKRVYDDTITFATGAARERWQRMVLGALAYGGITGGSAPATTLEGTS